MELVLFFGNIAAALAVSRHQSYLGGCKLRVEYPNGICLRIQNQNISDCPSLNAGILKDGHVLGHCDSVTYVDRNPDRIPEFVFHKECLPECCNRSCSARDYYWCTQVYSHIAVKIHGNITQVPVRTDCLCMKNNQLHEQMDFEYDEQCKNGNVLYLLLRTGGSSESVPVHSSLPAEDDSNYTNARTRMSVNTPCRLRIISLASFVILLFSNIWLIIRLLNASQCQTKLNEELRHVEDLRRLLREAEQARLCKEAETKPYFESNNEVDEVGFNVSFLLGRWDRHRLFKMYDSVYVGQNFTQLSERFSVCMATQSSLEKLHSVVQVAHQWTGPISAAVYAAGDDEYFLLHWYVNFLKTCFSSIRLRVSFHLLVPKSKLPTGKYPSGLKELGEKKYECRTPEAVLKDILKLRSIETSKFRTKNVYPQNHMRNLARKNCQSSNVFLTDIDIIPSSNLAESLDEFLKSTRRKCVGKCAYVIPTYELDDRAGFPKDKKDLVRLSKKGLARAFHHKVFIYNQYATNFSRWEAFPDSSQDEVVVSHNVTNFEFLYEPFYVAPDTVPEHDERFMGYGYTRNTQVYEMFVAGYQFQVLSPIFTIHWGLQGRKGRPPWRERQNSLNRRQFEVFKREVFARYRKDPLKML